MTFGVFNGNYRGYGIYWSGTYNVNGDGEFGSLSAARIGIDNHIANMEQQPQNFDNCLIAERNGDNVIVQTPDGNLSYTIQEFRREVWNIEFKYNKQVKLVEQKHLR